ncbi:hypothetical protein D3C73_1586870 [compost metagenome]
MLFYSSYVIEGCLWIQVQYQRADFSTQEVVRATGTHWSQVGEVVGVDEFEHAWIISKMTDHPGMTGAKTA